MKKHYDGLEAFRIDLNNVDIVTSSPGKCSATAMLQDTGSGTCDKCGENEMFYEYFDEQ